MNLKIYLVMGPIRRFTLMIDHNGLRYSFDQPNLNVRKTRWLAALSEFDFKIRYIKGKENMIVDVLRKRVHVNHIVAMSSYGKNM